MLRVEFIGLPGAGKTTLASLAAARLQARGLTVLTRDHLLADGRSVLVRHVLRARFVVLGMLRQPGPFLWALRLIRQDGQPGILSVAKVAWNIWCVLGLYLWLSRSPRGIAILDQGLIQAIWSVRLAARGAAADWSAFLDGVGMIDGVLIAKCDQERAVSRLRVRANQASRLNAVTGDDPLWRRGSEAFEQACIDAARVAPVLCIDNRDAGELEHAVERVTAWIGSLLQEARRGA